MTAAAIALAPSETFTVGDIAVGLWEHDRCRAEWADHLHMLDDRERRRLAELSSPSRAIAFVAGRCCARAMLTLRVDPATPAAAWRIDVDSSGRPRPSGRAALGYAISISHADDLSVVALRRGPVGIDVEPLGRRIARDIAGLESAATPLMMLEAWTAKEARFKLDGTPVDHLWPCSSPPVAHVVRRSHLIAVATQSV